MQHDHAWPPDRALQRGRLQVDPRSDPAWAALMSGPGGSLFGSPPWITAVADTYGFTPSAEVLFDDDDGRPCAGLATVDVDDIRGARCISLPFGDYLDPVVTDVNDWRQVIDPVIARGVPVQLRVLTAEAPRQDPRFDITGELLWHSTDLRGTEADVMASLDAKARQGARSAVRQEVEVRFGSALEDVIAFHALHRQTRKRKYGLLAQPVEFFERIWQQFSVTGDITVGLAHHDGELIAGALYLFWNGTMYYKFGASIAERLGLRPNDLLAVESIRLGCARGSTKYDWGVSDLDQPGLSSFKRKFATDEGRVTVLRHTPAGPARTTSSATGALLGELTQLLTREDVPDHVTQRAGELLYRYFC